MDTKGDDSGSDTLDQSLQKKCVVADDDSSSKQPDAAVSEDNAADEPTTEPGGIMSDPKDSPASPSPPPSQQSSSDNSTFDAVLVVHEHKDLHDGPYCSGKDDSRGFESKVRQISNDLKDTTLADEKSLEEKIADKRDKSTGNLETDADAATVTLEDVKNNSDGYDSDRTITYDSPSKKSSSSSSEKNESKKITKKVRFKSLEEVINCSDDERDYESEYDDNNLGDDDENGDGHGLTESAISELLSIPLSFASPNDEEEENENEETDDNNETVGEARAQLHADEVELEDPPAEGGVQCILGKLSQLGKVEYLLRWVDKPGLQWESEDVLSEMCPNLIKLYEEKRASERERDMHYVTRRKKRTQDLRNV